MESLRRCLLLVAATVMPLTGQTLDDFCLVDDLTTIFEEGSMFDSSSAFNDIDSIVVTGGDCDSAAGAVYVGGLPFPLSMTAVKESACTLHVAVASGLIDTMVHMCGTAVYPVVGSLATTDMAAVRALLKLLSSDTDVGTEGVAVYTIDGSLVRKNAPLRSLAAGRYVARSRHEGVDMVVPFVR
ncbi:MAG: hypothetical protein GF331_03145 [Chitinivibrionales bacterium]|nr:hypothetical protein [Chitinivibrionales bacterium]